MVKSVKQSFQAHGVSLKAITAKLQSRIPFQKNITVNDIDDAFMQLTKVEHSSWFHTNMFSEIVKDLGSSIDKEQLIIYEKDVLEPYLQRSIYAVPNDSYNNSDNDDSTCIVKLHLMIADKLIARNLMAKDGIIILKNLQELMETSTLSLYTIIEGCVLQLVFSIPSEVFECYDYKSSLHCHIKLDDKERQKYWITTGVEYIL